MTHSPEHLWFMDTLMRVRLSSRSTTDGVSIIEQTAPRGDSPPLHRHVDEDEVFHLLEGELRFSLDGNERRVTAGETVTAPQGVPHTYRVESEGARWLIITARGRFEDFVRAMARPAARAELPPPGGRPSPEAMARLAAMAKQFGIEILGPPLAD